MAFAYWAGIAFASVILLMIFHATHARWVTVLRRPSRSMSASVPIFLLLFIPLILGMKHVYVWVDPPASLGREALKLIAGKKAYLNTTGFIVRGRHLLRRRHRHLCALCRLVAEAGRDGRRPCCCRSSATSARAGCRSSPWRSPSRRSTG